MKTNRPLGEPSQAEIAAHAQAKAVAEREAYEKWLDVYEGGGSYEKALTAYRARLHRAGLIN